MNLKTRNIYDFPWVELYTGKIWCKSVHKFWSYRPKCHFIQMIHMIRIRRRIILIMLHFLANVKGNFLTKLSVAESSHLFTNVMTDTQTHTHTHRQILGKKHNAFRHKKKEFCLVLSHLALESTPVQCTHYPLSHHISPSPLLFSVRFLCAIRIWREFFYSERTSSVPCKSRHKRNNEALHVTPWHCG